MKSWPLLRHHPNWLLRFPIIPEFHDCGVFLLEANFVSLFVRVQTIRIILSYRIEMGGCGIEVFVLSIRSLFFHETTRIAQIGCCVLQL